MTLDKVAGLEDVEAGQGKEAKHLYDPHNWLDPAKIAEEGRLSPSAWERSIQRTRSSIRPMHKSLKSAVRN